MASIAIKCFRCVDEGNSMVKNGKTSYGKQRFICRNCKKSRVENYKFNAYLPNLNQQIIILTKEGLGIRSTARVLKISATTLLKRIISIARNIKPPMISLGKEYEVDDQDFFDINSNNEMVVKKAGTYHIQTVISLNSTSENSARDAYEAMVLINGSEPTPNLRTAYGFPSGGTSFDSNTAISGFVTLQENDRISLRVNRYYRDVGTNVTIQPNGSMSNITLRYMGIL